MYDFKNKDETENREDFQIENEIIRAPEKRAIIWIHSIATNVTSKMLHVEEAPVLVVKEEYIENGNTLITSQCVTKNDRDETVKVNEEMTNCDLELRAEYRRLLVDAVALRIKRKIPEVKIWQEIERETGFNHKMMWDRMRKITMKKIMGLLPADDIVKNIPKEMQLSSTDWLLFDRILVHEKINVLNTVKPPDQLLNCEANTKSEVEPQCLHELFELVKQYNIENLAGELLVDAWRSLTFQYNRRGRRCSRMLLQLRWYQMKELTRSHFNTFNGNKKQDFQQMLQSKVNELTALQIAIAMTFNRVITEKFETWEILIDQRRVILSEHFNSVEHGNKKMDFSPALKPSDEMICHVPEEHNNMENSIETTQSEIDNLDESREQFKRHLIKKIAAMVESREMTVKGQKLKLRKLLGREWKEMWKRMRAATIKKAVKLLEADDVTQEVSAAMRLTPTEWLLFDLVLVHENIEVVNHDKLEKKCLSDLVELIHEYRIETLVGEELAEAWINLMLKYNTGGRQCSPMLLQLRWYQIKQMTRQQVYKPSVLLSRNKIQVLISIATKCQKIITRKWLKWATLVQNKRVILSEEFVTTIRQKNKWNGLEPHEEWYLGVKKDISNISTLALAKDTANLCDYFDPSKCNTTDKFTNDLEKTSKDKSELTIPTPNQLKYSKEPEIIELDSDEEMNEVLDKKADNLINITQEKGENILIVTKVTSISETINKNTINEQLIDNWNKGNNDSILSVSDDEMDELLQQKAHHVKKLFTHCEDDFTKNDNPKLCGIEVEKSVIIKKELTLTDEEYESPLEDDFDVSNIEIIDDGIKFEEEFKYNTTNDTDVTVLSSSSDDNGNADETEDEPKIDLKLLMTTAVYTKRIDCMEVFKFIDYDSVNDKRVIEYVELQSKQFKPTPEDKDIERFRKQAIPRNQKATIHSYENKTVGNKLVNKTKGIYSTQNDFKSAKARSIDKNNEFNIPPPTTSDISKDQSSKLAQHVRDLIATMTADDNEENDLMSDDTPKLSVKRSKIINLPDKKLTRLINQSLQTAEIAPTHQPPLKVPTVKIDSEENKSVRSSVPEESPRKRFKTDSETSQCQSTNAYIYCCWVRLEIERNKGNFHGANRLHTCNTNQCTCCCRNDLVKPASKTFNRQKPNGLQINRDLPKSAVTNSTQTYNKECGTASKNKNVTKSVYAESSPGLNALRLNNPANKNVVSTVTVTANMSKGINRVRDRIGGFSKHPGALVTDTAIISSNDSSEAGNTITEAIATNLENKGHSKFVNTPTNASTKVLNCITDSDTSDATINNLTQTKSLTSDDKTEMLVTKSPKNISASPTYIVLPPGVNLVTVDNTLALAINPGVKLNPADLRSLMSVSDSVDTG